MSTIKSTCPTCKGTGVVEYISGKPTPIIPQEGCIYPDCLTCKGKGKIKETIPTPLS